MPIYMRFSSPGRSFGSGKGLLHGIKLGVRPVTPLNFNSCLSFSMGPTSPRDAASGLPTGKRQNDPIVITKEKDSSSPLLLNAHWAQEVFASLDLSFVRCGYQGGGSGVPEQLAATISLTNGAIVGYKTYHGLQTPPVNKPRSGSTNIHANELEEFEMTFQKITFTNVFKSKGGTDDWLAQT
jgi:type VI secretion system secreted protein Hcp